MAKHQSNTLPKDRFDDPQVRGRVGVHRIVGKPKRFLTFFVAALLGTLVLTAGGIAAVMVADINVTKLFEREDQAPGPQPEPSVQPQLDPAAQVVVLNGTPVVDFGFVVDLAITENQWGQVIFTGEAETNDIDTTTVYYLDEADEAAALGLAEQLGVRNVSLGTGFEQYGARLVVVIGTDYAGPGKEELDAGLAAVSNAPEEQ